MTTATQRAAALVLAGRYLQGRQCPQGGFCFYRSEYVNEPNLADTFHAVSALRLLGIAPLRPDLLHDYLRGIEPSAQPWDLFHLTGTLRVLDPGYAPRGATRDRIAGLRIGPAPECRSVHLSGWLARARVIALLQRDCGVAFDRDRLARAVVALMHDGGFGAGPNLFDTGQAIDVLQACGATPDLPGLASFVDRLQTAFFAFRGTVDSCMGRLHLVWAGTRCCRALGLPLHFGGDALDFTLACQTGGGGFADAPDALPDIVQTHRAIELLTALLPRAVDAEVASAPTRALRRRAHEACHG